MQRIQKVNFVCWVVNSRPVTECLKNRSSHFRFPGLPNRILPNWGMSSIEVLIIGQLSWLSYSTWVTLGPVTIVIVIVIVGETQKEITRTVCGHFAIATDNRQTWVAQCCSRWRISPLDKRTPRLREQTHFEMLVNFKVVHWNPNFVYPRCWSINTLTVRSSSLH